MNTNLAKGLTENVRAFYEQHGAWFATTRGKVIPEHPFVSEFIRPGMTIVDVGAGNGRFANLLPKNTCYIGIEPSEILRALSLPSHLSLVPGTLPHLPLPDAVSDVTVCLAVLHHIPTQTTRRTSVEELIRITKPGGIMLATSWLRNPHGIAMTPISEGEAGDVWMPWQGLTSEEKGQRYVHFMQSGEWERLWTNPGLDIVQIGMYGKKDWTSDQTEALNWRVIAKRR